MRERDYEGDGFDAQKYVKSIFNHLNQFKSNIKNLSSKLTDFQIPEKSGLSFEHTRRALAAIEEITKGHKAKSMLWFERGSAFISDFLNKLDQGRDILDYDFNELFEKNSLGKTVLANVTLENRYDSETAALLTFLKLGSNDIKVVLSKETAFCCIGLVDKDGQRYTSVVFAKN